MLAVLQFALKKSNILQTQVEVNMRQSAVQRTTKETDISLELNLDGTGWGNIATDIGFFDHMLNAFARHGLFDLDLKCKGDLEVDSHHSVEDTGIVLGTAIANALGDKSGINRVGSSYMPMDEALAFCALDISGRPYLVFDAPINTQKLGNYDTELTEEFFRAVAVNAGMTVHIKADGKNAHHIIEAIFKAFARALSSAVENNPRVTGIPSTKGVL